MIKAFKLWLLGDPTPAQKSLFYSERTTGRDYIPPFVISNPACYGTTVSVEPPQTKDAVLVIAPSIYD